MKQRFSSLDVKVIAHELHQSLVTLRLANVHDLSSKILLFKFAKTNNKQQMVIDTGFRCHLTKFARTTAATPSAFVARLRKLLKTRRVTSVSQVGTDRIIEFQFSDGQYRMFLEFFASGNIILTDADLNILSLSRNVSEGEGQEPQRVGLQYSLDKRQNFHGVPPLTKERVQDALKAAIDKSASVPASQKLKKRSGGDLRNSLAAFISELPPVLVDHVLWSNGFDTTVKPVEVLENPDLLEELARLLSKAQDSVEHITSSDQCTGYIFAKSRGADVSDDKAAAEAVSATRGDLLYDDFHPFIPYKLQKDSSIKVLEFNGYNATVDEYYSSLEGQRLETRLNEREATARRKLDTAKADQAKRLEGLQEAQVLNMRKAAAIETNVEWVQEAMDAVNGLLAQGMDWVDIGKLIEREQKRNNPVAAIIVLPLNLAENSITLNLAEEDFEEIEAADPFETDESESEGEEDGHLGRKDDTMKQSAKDLQVDINLTISPWSNAREYYEQRRSAVSKEERTQQQVARALKNAEQKISESLKKGLKQEKALLQPIRRQLWFEKFSWFISSDGYLVLAGRDAQQNEILYMKHLHKGDVYCHADLKGAPSVVIKNKPSSPDAPIPPATLAQAGSLSVCASEAWDQKAGMGAWWVKADQVSKSAPAGDFLPIGVFSVRGTKNFLPPTQLLLGLGLAFRISEESKARHIKHRVLGASAATSMTELDSIAPSKPHGTTSTAHTSVNNDSEIEDAASNDSEGEDEDHQDDVRANPLQTSRPLEPEGEVEEAAEAVTSLSLNDAAPITDTYFQAHLRDDEEAEETNEPNLASPPSTTSKPQHPQAKKAAAPTKRGQKGKAKKMASKYKDQDEEDRAAASALLGATTGQKRLADEAHAQAQRQAALEAAKERRRAQHHRQQAEIAKHESLRHTIDAAPEPEDLAVLDTLVGTPLPGDDVLEVVPLCAPWTALTRFKYKAKMQPGPLKKGKAVKEILERWKVASEKKGAVDEESRDTERMWPREVQLIKGVKAEEVVNCVPAGKVRVMMGGGGDQKKGGGKGGKGKR